MAYGDASTWIDSLRLNMLTTSCGDDLSPASPIWPSGEVRDFGRVRQHLDQHFRGFETGRPPRSVSSVETTPFEEVQGLAERVEELLRHVDRRALRLKPNSAEPTVAESLALSMLELDRIASEHRVESRGTPKFASDFLNRRLSRRLLERYPGLVLAAVFNRRLHEVLQLLASDDGRQALGRLHSLLTDLEAALVQRPGAVDDARGAQG